MLLNTTNSRLKDFIISVGITYLACSIIILFATKSLTAFVAVPLLILLITIAPFFWPPSFWPHTISIIALLGAIVLVLMAPIASLFKIAALLLCYCLWFYFDFQFFAPVLAA